jgi:hypothetical protein
MVERETAMQLRSMLISTLLCATLAGCGYIAVTTAPEKKATTGRTEAALKADALFWDTLHGAKYDQIPSALEAVTGAYLANPSDPVTAAHAGWLHIWRLAENARLDTVPASITDDATLARKYFDEAVKLHQGEARYLGFLASATLAEANIHKDEKLTRKGYYQMLDAVEAWPEFNLFTAGYTMSRQPADSERYKQAVEWQWETLDVCVGEKVPRANPGYAKYMSLATTEGKKRVCWNSWIAPHNFEGFFLNMGDMLVKAGDWQAAQKIYGNAKLSPTYGQWKFRDVLEQRIRDAQTNVAVFKAADLAEDKTHQRIMVASTFACMGCHQN